MLRRREKPVVTKTDSPHANGTVKAAENVNDQTEDLVGHIVTY